MQVTHEADIAHLRERYTARKGLATDEGEAWVEQVSQVLHRTTPDRAEEFDTLTPYLFAGLSTQVVEPTWQRIGGILRAAIGDLERTEATTDIPVAGATPDRVFVVHGRNDALRASLFAFLRAIGLAPLEFSQAIEETGKATPYVGEILDKAFEKVQAVVVLLSPDDEVRLTEALWSDEESDEERNLRRQVRPNVLFEAGMAFGTHADRTVLVQVGQVKPFSDVAGRSRRSTG